jgi:hypothetical protein
MYSACWATCTTFGSEFRRRPSTCRPGVSSRSVEQKYKFSNNLGPVVRAEVLREERDASRRYSYDRRTHERGSLAYSQIAPVGRSMTTHPFRGMKEWIDEIGITDQYAYIEAHLSEDGCPL